MEVSLTMRAVQLVSIVVDGKAMTRSLFRQLHDEPVIDEETGALRGLVWGRVNYHADRCEDWAEHRHLVWERQGILLRSLVPLVPAFDRPRHDGYLYKAPEVELYAAWQVHAWIHDEGPDPFAGDVRGLENLRGFSSLRQIDDGLRLHADLPACARRAAEARRLADQGAVPPSEYEPLVGAALKLSSYLAATGKDAQESEAIYRAVTGAERARRQATRETTAALMGGPQLFLGA